MLALEHHVDNKQRIGDKEFGMDEVGMNGVLQTVGRALLLASLLLTGCPSPEGDCQALGTCDPGAPCTAGRECRAGACGPVVAGGATECLRPCTSAAECPSPQTCELLPGAGAFCQGGPAAGDAGPRLDGGPPGDAGPDTDGDGDGLVSSMDCDDTDTTVGAMSVETCTSACGYGTVVCTNGTRTACSAPAECGCPMPGEVRTVSCGRCGIASQTCGADSRWSMPSACTDERECMAGTVEVHAARCGREERVCDGMCAWRAWTEVVPLGECEPGETVGEMTAMCGAGAEEIRTCGTDCTFGDPEGCRPVCTRGPRTSRLGLESVCVPAGPFILGSDALASAQPPRTITLSEYWFALEPVTAADYRACVTAGGCSAIAATDFAMADPVDAAVGVSQSQAAAFCVWDGGSLPSEFQWEKAGRGPAPSVQPHPWGDGRGVLCEEVPGAGCESPPDTTMFAGSYSPYRAHLMATINEWTTTRFRDDWTWIPDGSTDPAGPPADRYPRWSMRGAIPVGPVIVPNTVSRRIARDGTEADVGFRCVY